MRNIIIILLSLIFAHSSWADEASEIKSEAEAGIVLTGGNNQISTLSFKDESKYVHDMDSYVFKARYLRSSNAGVEQALQWGLGIRYERLLNPNFAIFIGQLVESNVYQNIFQRYATDLGGKYYFFKSEKELVWFAEAGYRFTRENYLASFKNINFARLYTEVERFWNPTLSGKLYLEYLPNIAQWKAYQANIGASANAAISSVFSLKTAFDLKYNNEPPAGAISTSDRIFTTSLVAKF